MNRSRLPRRLTTFSGRSQMSKIEWCDETWNPVTGCTPISEGCLNCYAQRMSKRLAGRCGYDAKDPFEITEHKQMWDRPYKWKKPRRVFVCSMGDLFHNQVPHFMIDNVLELVKALPQHTFIILTKRPENIITWAATTNARHDDIWRWSDGGIKNLWLGVTVENRAAVYQRIPRLLEIPAAVRFISVEPMLESIDITPFIWPVCEQCPRGYSFEEAREAGKITYNRQSMVLASNQYLDWVICGAETGTGKREMKTEWASDLQTQCVRAEVPFFFKKDSDGNRELDGQIWEQLPKLSQ